MSAQFDSFCISIFLVNNELKYTVYTEEVIVDPAGKITLPNDINPEPVLPNTGLSDIKSALLKIITERLPNLQSLYEAKYKNKITTTIKQNFSKFFSRPAATTILNTTDKSPAEIPPTTNTDVTSETTSQAGGTRRKRIKRSRTLRNNGNNIAI